MFGGRKRKAKGGYGTKGKGISRHGRRAGFQGGLVLLRRQLDWPCLLCMYSGHEQSCEQHIQRLFRPIVKVDRRISIKLKRQLA